MVAAVARAALGPAAAVDVDVDVLLELLGVLEPIVLGSAVGDEPGDALGLAGGKVAADGLAALPLIEVDPLLVGRHQFAVVPVGGRPVEHILVVDELRVQRALEHVHDPDLLGCSLVSRWGEEIYKHTHTHTHTGIQFRLL